MNAKTVMQIGVSLVVFIVLLHAFTVQRVRNEQRNDDRISATMDELSTVIGNQIQADGAAPESIGDVTLSDDLRERVERHGITYKPGEGLSTDYELCATFQQASEGPEYGPFSTNYSFGGTDTYTHDAGEECFTFNAYSSNYYDDFYDSDPQSYEFDQGDLDSFDFSDPSVLEGLQDYQVQ